MLISAVQVALSTSVAANGPGVKSSSRSSCGLMPAEVVLERLTVEQVALLAAPAGIADHAGRTAGQRERAVAAELEAAQPELAHQVADVQRVGGRVEPDVDADRAVGQARTEERLVGRVVDQAAGVQVGEQVHAAAIVPDGLGGGVTR